MSTPHEPLASFLADFYGVLTEPPERAALLAWCASTDGQAHAAPAVTVDATSDSYYVFATDADRVRFAAMYADLGDWIINTLQRPPGWTHKPNSQYQGTGPLDQSAEALNGWRNSLQRDPTSNELRDWARTWTAAHPS